jgi:CheY-like chemotaxis protein/tetratricopeptide (TPR) repeat protein
VLVESCSGRYNDALRVLTDATQLFEESTNDVLKGKFHNELACALMFLGQAERRPDYTDRALIEYTAASHYFEQAGHISYRASAESNLGFLLYLVGRYQEAHEHLNRARRLFLTVRDKGRIAQVDDARARVLLAEGRTQEAERASREAVRMLEKGGEQALLAEALTTQGHVLAKLGSFTESLNTLRRAADLAEAAGAVEDAGRALLTLIEEHADRVAEYERLETYQRAHELLSGTQDAETIARLRACASGIVTARLTTLRPRRGRSLVDFWANFNLPEKVHSYEARYVRRALIDAQGSITRAALLLGYPHHGTLASMLEGRHKELAPLRIPPETRRRSIMREIVTKHPPTRTRPIRILHVEDYKIVAEGVKDTLGAFGWTVETCADGIEAKKILAGNKPYDLLIFDNELPGLNAIELMSYVGTLLHRRRTPIIMFSASDVEREARGAGADAFLRKPEDIDRLTATVTRLLSQRK